MEPGQDLEFVWQQVHAPSRRFKFLLIDLRMLHPLSRSVNGTFSQWHSELSLPPNAKPCIFTQHFIHSMESLKQLNGRNSRRERWADFYFPPRHEFCWLSVRWVSWMCESVFGSIKSEVSLTGPFSSRLNLSFLRQGEGSFAYYWYHIFMALKTNKIILWALFNRHRIQMHFTSNYSFFCLSFDLLLTEQLNSSPNFWSQFMQVGTSKYQNVCQALLVMAVVLGALGMQSAFGETLAEGEKECEIKVMADIVVNCY